MNIKDAKTEIIHTLRAYNRKDRNGRFCYPRVRQRPILLIGPPGIGKTAIMEQVAEECGVGLVSYTITHHTRQSAIGLPHIESRTYAGVEMTVTEYTMSEIIASVYACMEKTGKREGILFIDEINCVSETLAPTMLQFLQNKTFGSHRVPDGWLIVAAGNPPEYNKSVREFDIVTLDRVRKIEVQEDLDVWEEYARTHEVHSAILAYLAVRKHFFYLIDQRADSRSFVTARGWEDLSELLKNYEELGISVSWELIMEYLQKEEVARDFAAFYQLFRKYGTDYSIREILDETLSPEAYEQRIGMLSQAGFDEKTAVTELLLDGLTEGFRKFAEEEAFLELLHEHMKKFRASLGENETIQQAAERYLGTARKTLAAEEEMEVLSMRDARLKAAVLDELKQYLTAVQAEHLQENGAGFDLMRLQFQKRVEKRNRKVQDLLLQTENAFAFLEESCGDGPELVLLVSALSRADAARKFLSEHECESYLHYSGKLLYKEREKELQKAAREMSEKIGK